ncbi:MAG: lysine-sensitive aspartokinase 3 [Candidatus Kapaibacterium sp.]|nr:lysine-sensitive aspartokinase 3 [Ignavibacteriota bacterium]MCB9220859.1 lysine-sensitive aspartokinase 3 [Ignavibacteria bacterium]
MNNSTCLVLKFGGTSVKDAETINKVLNIVSIDNTKKVIIVSAHAGVTNLLVEICNSKKDTISSLLSQLYKIHSGIAKDLNILDSTKEFIMNELSEIDVITNYLPLSPQLKDVVMSKGEVLSSMLIYTYFKEQGKSIAFVDSREVMKTNSQFTNAELYFDLSCKNIEEQFLNYFDEYDLIIMGGFIASDEDGRPTTLGRGGSDYTAAVVSSALNATELQIWTDVNGILTSDPRFIEGVKKVRKLSYSEASELSFFGAKVLHPSTIHPAVKKGIPVRVKNTFNPNDDGTLVLSEKSNIEMIKAIAFRKDVITITLRSNRMLGAYGFMSKVFQSFEKLKIPVDIVTTSEVSISVTVNKNEYNPNIEKELSVLGEVTISEGNAIISAIGEGIKETAGIANRLFGALKGINISMVSVGASEVNLSIVVSEEDLQRAVTLLHNEFFNDSLNPVFFE